MRTTAFARACSIILQPVAVIQLRGRLHFSRKMSGNWLRQIAIDTPRKCNIQYSEHWPVVVTVRQTLLSSGSVMRNGNIVAQLSNDARMFASEAISGDVSCH